MPAPIHSYVFVCYCILQAKPTGRESMNVYIWAGVGILFAAFGAYSVVRRRFTISRGHRRRGRGVNFLGRLTLRGWPAVIAGGSVLVAGLLWAGPPLSATVIGATPSADSIPFTYSIVLLVAGVGAGAIVQIIKNVRSSL